MPDHSPAAAFAHTCGPRDAKIVIVGEAWGEHEQMLGGTPFVGWSGFELSRMLHEAGLTDTAPLAPRAYSSIMQLDWWSKQPFLLTNVLAFRPPDNKLDGLCSPKAEVGKDYSLPAMGKGGYLRPEYLGELERLREELAAHPRHCVIALGATATWALMREPKITAVRGVASASTLVPGLKILPTYHPAGVLRNWKWRPIALADLMKVAIREGKFPEIKRPERTVIINPTLSELRAWLAQGRPLRMSCDIETKNKQIEMVGLARSRSDAIVIPFIDRSKPGYNYWPTVAEECEAWELLRVPLADPGVEKIGQNFLYDLQYFWRRSPIRPFGVAEDTMLLSHSMFPEMQKSLGFLGSLYTAEASWKMWRGKEQEELKRDE